MTYLYAYIALSLLIGIAANFIGPNESMTFADRVVFTILFALLWPVVAAVLLVALVC